MAGTFSAGIYEPVELVGPYFDNEGTVNDPTNPYYRYPLCEASATITEDKWVVLQDYLGDKQPALATVLGVTWVKANITNLAHTHLTVDSGNLVSGESGRARIISPPPATGIGFVLVMLGSGGSATSEDIFFHFTLLGDLTTGTTTADIHDLDNWATTLQAGATIKASMEEYKTLLTGDKGWCYKQGDNYYIGNSGCPGSGTP